MTDSQELVMNIVCAKCIQSCETILPVTCQEFYPVIKTKLFGELLQEIKSDFKAIYDVCSYGTYSMLDGSNENSMQNIVGF